MEVSSISAVQSIWEGFDFTYILSIIQGIIPALLCITLHEISHGYTACLLGDDTAKLRGRLSLNPIRHLDWMGLLMMVVFHFGWAKPVPINMYKFKNPKRDMAITAIAGPLSNVLITIIVLVIYGLLYIPLCRNAIGNYVLRTLFLTAYMSLGLAIFNIIPVPPLDGSKVLFSVISDRAYYNLMRYERYGSLIMIALIASGTLGRPLSNAITFVFDKLVPIAQACCDAVFYLFYK